MGFNSGFKGLKAYFLDGPQNVPRLTFPQTAVTLSQRQQAI